MREVKEDGRVHTPGPWKTDPEVEHEMVLGSDGKMVADCSIFARRKNEVATNRANARLIAAAPEMLRALEKAEELYQTGLLNAPDGLAKEVADLRRRALSASKVQR